ncbi:MAG: HEAT repeat domain-containing protein [Planctomycetaceae bacterium]
MAQRSAFKTDSSFFRMLAVGAVGAQAVQQHLNALGHHVVELERGSLATRIWRDVKRKRVRIPDLCCTRCGVRIESRAKTSADLSMSHSPSDAERAWNYGMLDSDWIAFPILAAEEGTWNAGALGSRRSLWRERSLTTWHVEGRINLFTVESFRGVAPKQLKPKGVSEGSEVQVKWKARFAPGSGKVVRVSSGRLDYSLDENTSKARHFRLGEDERAFLADGDQFQANQVVAGQIAPLATDASRCAGGCDTTKLKHMLGSRERTVRFTGCKLARFAKDATLASEVRELAQDGEEDAYVRMEARSYLCEVAGDSADEQFRSTLLSDTDDQMRLEACVALAETRTATSFALLRTVLEDAAQPLFLRSACAWGIGCHGTKQAAEVLVRAFADVAPEIREEALIALQELGPVGFDPLLKALKAASTEVAAGAAEALRRIPGAPAKEIAALVELSDSTWPTWALAHLPKDAVTPYIAALQSTRPDVHYAVSVLWTFLGSWIAEDWTPRSTP